MNKTIIEDECSLISVVIPTFNHAAFLPTVISSVLDQTYRKFEIIVVDDGSTDYTCELLNNRYKGTVTYIAQTNRGLASARNLGLRKCNGKYVVFIDADDRLLSSHLQINLKAIHQNPNVAFVCGNLRTFGPCNDFQHIHNCLPLPDHYASILRGCFIVNVGACLFRRDILTKIGGFNENLAACEDWDLFLRIVRKYPMYCHHQIVMEYQRRPEQMSQEGARMFVNSLNVLSAQRKYIVAKKEYKMAYYDGIQSISKYYGDKAIAELPSLFLKNDFRTAWCLLFKLVRWYPKGLLRYSFNTIRNKQQKYSDNGTIGL